MDQIAGIVVGGEERQTAETCTVLSPWSGETVARSGLAGPGDFDEAAGIAEEALAAIRAIPDFRRAEILRDAAERLLGEREAFARLLVAEAGKPLRAARTEVTRAVLTLETSAGEATRIGGEWMPLEAAEWLAGRSALLRRFPVGPVAAITPFNFPLNLVAHKLGPAVAAGCPVVLKPARQTPSVALGLARLLREAGWPGAALSVLPARPETAAALARDPRFRLLTFTGSAEVGWALRAQAGSRRVALELGGNAAAVVCADADISDAAARCAAGAFGYSGQSCISVQRIFAERPVFGAFVEALAERAASLRCGDPAREETDVGPLITEGDARRVEEWIREAQAGGARVVTGGLREGSVVSPAVLTGTRPDMRVNCNEVFGPVVTVEPFDAWEEAIARVNDSRFGLQAGVFTRDLARALDAHERLEVGGVVIGDAPTFRADPMPYGGAKDSGLGREGIRFAIEEMTELRALVLPGRP